MTGFPAPTDPLGLACVAVILVAVGFRSTFGFGDALLSMPLLTLLIGPQLAAPLFAVTSPVVGTMILLQDRGSVHWSAAGRLLVAAALGTPLGVLLLTVASPRVLSIILGISLLFIGAWGLLRKASETPWLVSPHWAWPFGLVSGVLGGALNATGPPAVVYASGRAWSPAVTRATLQGFFLPISILITGTHAAAGLWSRELLTLAGATLPGVILAVLAGRWLHRRIPAARYHRVLNGILVALGLLCLVA